jgi:hypothetical protein
MLSNVTKIEISVADEGEGMDFKTYNNFKQLRADLSGAIRSIKEQKDLMEEGDRKKGLTQAIRNLEQFQLNYFFDFNSYMQKKSDYASGGVGLLYVLRMFDNVEFRNITDNHRVVGLEVLMEKFIPA